MRTYLYIAFICTLIMSCKPNTEITETKSITTHLSKSPKGLNPLIYQGANDIIVSGLMIWGFADYNPKTLEFEPIMIEELPEPLFVQGGEYDGKIRFDMKILPEATWEDGSPVTGDDYLFTVKCIMHPKTNAIRYRAYLENLIDVTVDGRDKKRVSVFMDENNIAGMELISSIPVLQKSVYDKGNTLEEVTILDLRNEERYALLSSENSKIDSFASDFNSNKYSRETISGAGRYKLKEWLSDQYIVLEKVENHWADSKQSELTKGEANEIIFLLTPDEAAAYAQLKAGVYDIYSGLSFQQMEDLQNDDNYKDQFLFEPTKLPRYYYMPINSRKKKLQEKAVRQAIARLIDVDTIIASYEKGFGERINSQFLSVDSQSELKDITFDPQKAEQILDSNGWVDSNGNGIRDKVIDGELIELEIDIMSTGSQLGQLIAGVSKQLMEPSGFKVTISNYTGAIYTQKLNNLDFDIALGAKGQSLAPYDPYPMLHTDNTDPGESNKSNFGTIKSDQLIDFIRTTTDPLKRDQAYLELEKIMYDQQNLIFLYAPTSIIVYKKGLKGVKSIKKPGFALNTFSRIE